MNTSTLIEKLTQAKEKIVKEKNYRNRQIDNEVVKIDSLNIALNALEDAISSLQLWGGVK